MLTDIFYNDNIYDYSKIEKILKYCNILTQTNLKIPHKNYFLSQKKYENIPVIGENVAYILYFLSTLKQPKKILEIGFGSGYSAIAILSGIKDRESISFISLEREKKRYKRGKKLLNHFKYNIDLKNIDFFDYIKEIKKNNMQFDFVFIDSVKRRYLEIFKLLEDHISRDGLIIFDNILFKGKVVTLKKGEVKKYLAGSKLLNKFNIYASLNNKFKFIFLPVDDGIAVGIRK